MSTIAAATDVHRTFGKTVALDTGTFHLEEGCVHGLVGRNGAGKTTLLHALSGQLRTRGDLTVFGVAPFDEYAVLDRAVLAGIDVAYPQDWSVRRMLRLAGARYPHWSPDAADRLVELFELPRAAKIATMSRGQRSAVGVVVGLAARADLTLLDEPYLGLDAQNRHHFYDALLDELDEHPRTVVVSTHHLDEAERTVDRVLILDDGRILADAHVDELTERVLVAEGGPGDLDVLRTLLRDGRLAGVVECTTDQAPGMARSSFDVAPDSREAFENAASGCGLRVRPSDLTSAVVALGAPAGRTADRAEAV